MKYSEITVKYYSTINLWIRHFDIFIVVSDNGIFFPHKELLVCFCWACKKKKSIELLLPYTTNLVSEVLLVHVRSLAHRININ